MITEALEAIRNRFDSDQEILEATANHLETIFSEIDKILGKSRTEGQQIAIEGRLRSSVGRIIAVGIIERRYGFDDTPLFEVLKAKWNGTRNKASGLGYNVREFEEYLKEGTKKTNSPEAF